MTRVLGVLFLLAGGCATKPYVVIDGKRVERPSVEYQSDYYWLEHRQAYPGVFDSHRGLAVSDGEISGRICNVDVNFDAEWYRARLHLDGRGDAVGLVARTFLRTEGLFRFTMEVTELGPGRRRISSTTPPIDLDISPERLKGNIGPRDFDLVPDGDYLAGRYERHRDVVRPMDEKYAIYGRRLLATMVPADEALVLLLMMTCSSTIEYAGKTVRGFSMVSRPREP